MRVRRFVFVALLAVAPVAMAQTPTARVRLTTAAGRETGMVVAVGADSLRFTADSGGRRTLARSDVTRLEVSRGMHRSREEERWVRGELPMRLGLGPSALTLSARWAF